MEIPLAIYRLQFCPGFGFREAAALLPYLADLGISHIYASPIFQCRKGSAHGYDVIDHNRLNAELGSQEDFGALIAEVKKRGMGWIQDIVPNHMAFDGANRMLMDVLEHGRGSPYYGFFDIDWDHPYQSLKGRVLAPFLGKFYAQALAEGEIRLRYDEEGLAVAYCDLRFPLRPASYRQVFLLNIGALESSLGPDDPHLISFLGTIDLLGPASPAGEAPSVESAAHAKRMLWKLYCANDTIRGYMDESLKAFAGPDAVSAARLDELLSRQRFRLSFWKVASEELNYRRFFTINDLISLHAQDEEVFLGTHGLALKAAEEGTFSGLRIDHIDGLFDPAAYLRRLRQRLPQTYIVVEKILSGSEKLPAWPVQGETGYAFLNQVNGLFCRRDNAAALGAIYAKFIRERTDFGRIACNTRHEIVERHMAGDIDNLAHLLRGLAANHRFGRDITLHGLRAALVETLAAFPQYRTYIDSWKVGPADAACIAAAVDAARRRAPALLYELDFIEYFLLLRFDLPPESALGRKLLGFVMRFQQFTGALMAKGCEDTAFYVFNRLLSLSEVGGDPARFGVSAPEFHAFNAARAAQTPYAMNATTTHDTKRGEDGRCRIDVLSEIPGEWGQKVMQWKKMNRPLKKIVNGMAAPDANDEYYLYQTLVGAFCPQEAPLSVFSERMKDHIVKAVREAKVHTAWIKADEDYERACLYFTSALLAPGERNAFLADFAGFHGKIRFYGMLNSLSQTLLKMTCPGVPDFYQGAELWDSRMVDPDNRGPVDFACRTSMLRGIKERATDNGGEGLAAELLAAHESGAIKLFLIHRVLEARKRHAALFLDGEYIGLSGQGERAECVVAFARKKQGRWAVMLAPRFFCSLVNFGEHPLGLRVWGDTAVTLPAQAPRLWREAVTGSVLNCSGTVTVGKLLSGFPVALLISEETGE